jgi:hypothetical protein
MGSLFQKHALTLSNINNSETHDLKKDTFFKLCDYFFNPINKEIDNFDNLKSIFYFL